MYKEFETALKKAVTAAEYYGLPFAIVTAYNGSYSIITASVYSNKEALKAIVLSDGTYQVLESEIVRKFE